ncbi:MAG: long-chain fatty acid--CoA ligase [Anaerolineae bacterium]|nr:long-chain fatty acid--CoA ligase [Anaerolineae bacterium]
MEKPWLKHYDRGVPHTIDYPDVPLHYFLEESARKYPDNVATVIQEGKLTYKELNEFTDRLAAALYDLGVRKGDRVALYLPNCPQYVIGFYAILKAGGISVAVNPLYAPREVAHQLNDSGAETIIVLSKMYPVVKAIRAQTKLKNVIVTNIKEYFSPLIKTLFTLFKEAKDGHRVTLEEGDLWLQALLARYTPEQRPEVEVGPDDRAIFQYTGGTTGVPKAAIGLHRNLVANALEMSAFLPDLQEGKEVQLAAIPLFHIYGLVTVMIFAVSTAASMIMIPNPRDLDEILKAIDKYKVTLYMGVPTMYLALCNHPDIAKYDVKSIKACISGSAPLPLEVKRRFEELTGGKLVEGYGLSEAPVASLCNPLYGRIVPGSIGVPFPDIEAKIVDLDIGTKDLPVGEIGELAIRGPIVMEGYWNMPEETALVMREGSWLLTGDIARMDEDGYFYIVDRKKDMILCSGYNVYPRDVEEVLFEHPKVLEASVAGIPDPYRGETVKAWIVLKPGETATQQEIIDYCRDKLAKFKIPTAVEFRKELPKTMVGKVLRRYLREEELKKGKEG